MAFTGEAVRQGSSNRFGVDSVGSTPRAFVSFNGEPYVITRNGLIHITDLANGSGVLIQNNADYDLSDADPTCGFVWNGRMYFLDRNDNILAIFDDPLNGDVSFINYYTGISSPSAATTDRTTVWIYESSFDALHTINPATAATILIGTVGFDVTTPANNIGGMFYHDGKLYLLDNGTELMFVIEDPTASTLEATAVDVAIIEFGASQRGVNGGGVHLGEAYMAGGNPDALYRFYNVRWDETIPPIEVNTGGNGSLDLTTVSRDATSFEFASGYTPPSWLTISGNDFLITSAPDVTTDTDYSPQVRAVRSSKHEDKTLTVRVLAAVVPPPIVAPGAPTSLIFTTSETFIAATWSTAANNGGEAPIRYDIRIDGGAWINAGLDLLHVFENLSADTEYLIEIAQVNSAGRGAIASESVRTDAVPTVPLMLGWVVPTDTVGLTFSVTLTSNKAIEGITTSDFAFRRGQPGSNLFVSNVGNLNSTLTPIAGTNNWRLDITLTGTYDDDYYLRLISGQIQVDGEDVPDDHFESPSFRIDSSLSITTPSLPTWQTGSALQSAVSALETTRINIANLVDRADTIQAVGGLQPWLDFDGTDLIVTDAPIVRKDTVFRVTLKATNDDGSRKAVYILTVNASKLAMLQSTLFFRFPSITYDGERVSVHGTTRIVREMTDNNYETYSAEADVVINTADADGNPTTIEFIALKTKKVERYSFIPSGGTGTGFSNRAMPTHFVATGGEAIPTVVNGYQHELYPLPEPVTATSVRMQFHGTDIEIYAVMLLELIAEIPDGDFLDILPDKVDRTGEIIEFPDGGVDRGNVIGAERWKWETQYVLEVMPEGTAFDTVTEVRKFISENPNIVHAQEPARYPDRIYPAIQAKTEISEELQGKYKGSGHIVPFSVAER